MPVELHPPEVSDPTPSPPRGSGGQSRALTDELVKEVADKVYALLMQDLVIERERQRPSACVIGSRGGG